MSGPRFLETIERHLRIKEGETTKNREYSLETVTCIGAVAKISEAKVCAVNIEKVVVGS